MMNSYTLRFFVSISGLLLGFLMANTVYSQVKLPKTVLEDSFKKGSYKDGVDGRAQQLDLDSDALHYPLTARAKMYDQFTIAAWINPTEYPDNGAGTFNSESPMTVFDLMRPGTRTLVRLHQKKPQFAFMIGDKWHSLNGRTPFNAGNWRHLAIVRKGDEFRIYADGELEVIDRSPGAKVTNWEHFTLGSQYKSQDRRFVGIVDELRVYSEALDDEQIRALVKETGGKLAVPAKSQTSKSTDGWMSFGLFPALRVLDDGLHPHIDQLSISAMIVPWTAADSKDLVIVAKERNLFGARIGIFKQVGIDEKNLPIYDEGRTLPGLTGTRFQAVTRPDGLFDLIGAGVDTPFGAKNLVQYRNLGTPGAPKFEKGTPVLIDGKFVAEAVGDRGLNGWSFTDVDGDGIPDLLMAVGERKFPYIPDGGGLYSGKILPNTGPGRGYDIEGNWLGGPVITKLLWGKGSYDSKGRLNISPMRIVHYRYPGFAVQWLSTASERAMTKLTLEGQDYLICTGNVDRILAMPLVLHEGELICGTVQPLLKNKVTIHDTYIIEHITVSDIDGDGHPELLLDGNPGRVVVLRGNRIGEFEEVGSLQMKGGPLAVDTLAVQNRVDFDGDGLPDLIIGDSSGYVSFWPGTKDPMIYGAPTYMTSNGRVIQHQAGMTGSIQGPSERRWGYTNPAVGDWNDDGKPEIILIDVAGRVTYYDRGDSPTDLKRPQLLTLQGSPLPAAWRVKPQILERKMNVLKRDKPCLLYLDWEGDLALAFPTSIGSTRIEESVKLKYKDGRNMPMCGPVGAWGRAKFSVVDWDGDGRWDVIVATNRVGYKFITSKNPPYRSTPMWLRNVGTNEEPVFEEAKLITLKDGTMIDFGVHVASPEASDMTVDGKPDLLLGGEDGKVYFFPRNTLKW